MARVIDLHNAPRVLTGADLATTDLNRLLGSDNSEWHEPPKLGVLLDRILVVLLDIVWEVVNGNTVVLDVLHNQLLRLGKLTGGQGIGATDDGDNVDARRQALHQLDVQLAETRRYISQASQCSWSRKAYPWPVGVMK